MQYNFCLETDSYKLNHWNQTPPNTQHVYSYFESRKGAKYNETVFFGLQAILKESFLGKVITQEGINRAAWVAQNHFCSDKMFNRKGFEYILHEYNGHLPLEIKAVPEGTPIPQNNVLMTVVNTDTKCAWLTNFAESRLTHIWHPSTVATLSREVKRDLKGWLEKTSDTLAPLPFMLHDFGYRSVGGNDVAAVGGSGHLVNFMGTDTLLAMEAAAYYYNAKMENLAFSVPATEHSIMTARGPDGEIEVTAQLLREYPEGILSMVVDSFNPYRFVDKILPAFKDQILSRKPNAFGLARVMVRPDSSTPEHPDPGDQMVWIAQSLAKNFGYTTNSKGFTVLNPYVGLLWGDGINHEGINNICKKLHDAKFSVENTVFGMGGHLLQAFSRDLERYAFKCSAQNRNGTWYDIYKKPKDESKASKKGMMKLIKIDNGYQTICGDDFANNSYRAYPDELVTVYRNGKLTKEYTFDEVRKNAEI